ncbi:MAG: MMPL family transporter [Acidimicrobiales bacterium]
MARLTALVLRHKLFVVLAWLALAVAGVMTAATTTSRLSADFSLPGQPGYVTDTHIAALYHNGGGQEPSVLVVNLPAGTTVSDPGVAPGLAATFASAGTVSAHVRVVDQATTGDPHFATAGGRTSFALVFTPPSGGPGAPDLTPRLQAAAAAAAPPGWHTQVTGMAQLASAGGAKGGNGVVTEALIAALASLVVLAFVFASFLAIVPLVMAAISIMTTFLLVLALTELTSVSVIVEFLIALIGLGVAIDYSLLVVTRWREQRATGSDNISAVGEAMASAGRSVAFSGLTVAVSLLALVVLPVPFLRNVGVAGFFIPLVSIAVALTLLPVILATAGPGMDWPRLRHEGTASRPWTAWARLVMRHRKVAALAGGAVLVALVVPLGSMRLGEPATTALSQSGPAHDALASLEAGGVPSGVLTPIEVLTSAADGAPLAARLGQVPGVAAALSPGSPAYRQGGTALVDVLPVAESSSPAGRATIAALHAAVAGDPAVVGVGGAGPSEVDFIHAVYGSFPLMLALIAVLTFVLLARAFRSLVLAAKAVLFNLASVGAAFGTMVLVWQLGYGSRAIWGIPATGSVTIWVPVMVFAFLFGLSMDYEVFIITRMREDYDATGSTEAAVVGGIGRTGRLVTSAALILFLGFFSLASGPETDLKVMATGLGAGILLDALVVRCLLVPALVAVLGRWNWWLPARAARVLRVAPSPLPAAAAGSPAALPEPVAA